MRRPLWSLILCVGLGVMALVATRSVEADRPGADERQPAASVCTSDAVEQAGEPACGRCGDGYCNPRCGETATNCPADCGATLSAEPACGKCGDGYCSRSCGETATSCPKDCGGTTS